MINFKRLLTVGLMALFCAGTATAASQLNSVQVMPSSNTATVNLHTTGSYAHKEYRPDEHLMLVDLTGVTAASAVDRTAAVNSAALKGYKLSTYTSASGSEVTRIELALGDGVSVSVNDVSDGLKIQLSSGVSNALTPSAPASVPAVAHTSPASEAPASKPALVETGSSSRPAPGHLSPATAPISSSVTKDAAKSAPSNAASTVTKNVTSSDVSDVKNSGKSDVKIVAKKSPPPSQAAAAIAPATLLTHATQPGAVASALPLATIRNVTVHSGQGTLDITIEGSNSARSFLLKNPDRLVLDFSDAVLQPSVKNVAVHTKDVLQVRVGRFQSEPPVVRIVVDLSGPRTFDVVSSEKQLVVRVKTGDAGISSAPLKAAPSPALASSVAPEVAGHLIPVNSQSVHAALANASITLPVAPAVAKPATNSTSELRDRQSSGPKPSSIAPTAAASKSTDSKAADGKLADRKASSAGATLTTTKTKAPKIAAPMVEAARPNPPAVKPVVKAEVAKSAASAPAQLPLQQTSAPKALPVVKTGAAPVAEAARPNPPAPQQSASAVVANKPVPADSPLPQASVSKPAAEPVAIAPKAAPAFTAAVATTSDAPKAAVASAEVARLSPPAAGPSPETPVAKPAPTASSQLAASQSSEPKTPVVVGPAIAQNITQPAAELALAEPPAIGPKAIDSPAPAPKATPAAPTAAAPTAQKVVEPAVESARLTPPAPEPSTATPAQSLTSGPKYTGEPISVNLKDVDLKDFFRLIHEISGLNIVLDPSVKGSVTLVLDDVPWDQALDIVLKNNSLDRELQGNVLRIAATDTLRKEAVDRRAQSEAIALAVDRQTITRFLSYAKAREISSTVKKFLTARGDVISDERTNALIISDIPSVLPSLDRLISQLDRKSPEVEIEVRVVSATRSFSRDLGVQLGFNWGNGVSTIAGSNPNGSILPTVTTPSGITSTVPLFSNFPATGPTTGISFSNITHTYGIDAILTAAETHNLAKVLSRPRVVTQSNVKAEVKQGVKLPVTTAATANALATTSYIDSVLRLSVTPQITADNTIFLTVDVENTQPQGVANSNGNFVLTTQQTTTQVLVTDGGTVVIGGVIQTSNSVSTTQTPLLGNIPWLGNLFKERFVKTETDELIFFITPKIVQT